MRIGLATPHIAATLDAGLRTAERLIANAATQHARIVCFPEAYLPGLRGQDFDVPDFSRDDEANVMQQIAHFAREHDIAVIIGMERIADHGRQIAAVVFDRHGKSLGTQCKTQLDPSEEACYTHGDTRQLFVIDELTFGIVICHEGWRYPETVRWAAARGAQIVFHPNLTGSDHQGVVLREWGSAAAPFYEKATVLRALENTIFFASVNYAMTYQDAATALIAPSGACEGWMPYGEEGVLVRDVDLTLATGLLARRFAPDRYR